MKERFMMFLRGLMAASFAALFLSGCAGGARVAPHDPPARQPACVIYMGAQRAAESTRNPKMTTCTGGSAIDPSGDTTFDVQSFEEIVDATMGADPCLAMLIRCEEFQLAVD